MKKKYFALCGICLVAFISGFAFSQIFFSTPQYVLSLPEQTTAFYARVIASREASLHVEGIPENDVNHRGQFYVSLEKGNKDAVVLNADGQQINLEEIPAGSFVLIGYRGEVLESFPAQIHGAVCIQIQE